MADGYIDVPIETNPDELAQDALEQLMELIPGWTPREGHIEVWIIEVVARLVAEAADVASRVPRSIFRYFGQSLLDLPAIDAARASVNTTWVMADTQGYTVPAGTVAAFRVAGDQLIAFETRTEFTVSPGQTTTLAGSVAMDAVEEGTVPNGLTGAMELVDALAFVSTVTATTASSGGVDAESDDSYLNRLSQELELLAPRPILASDFAVLARRVTGVHRALAIDNYNPADQTTNNERMVTVAVVDEAGAALSQAVKDEVQAYLDAEREVNFIVHVVDPTYTVINVATTFTKDPTYETAALETSVAAAIAAYLDPGNWAGGDQDPPEWRNETTVRYLELATLINNVAGVGHIDTLTINGTTADVALAGVAPLPDPGTIAATVSV